MSKELYISWLNDAYAMESALVKVMEHHADDAKDLPAVQEMVNQHLEETKRHVEMVKGCIERLGEQPSTAKSVIATMFGSMQAPMTGLSKNELVMNCVMDYAVENFEIATYRKLITAATQVGDQESVLVYEQIIQDELGFANKLLDGLPMVVTTEMQKVAAGTSG